MKLLRRLYEQFLREPVYKVAEKRKKDILPPPRTERARQMESRDHRDRPDQEGGAIG
jgi:hypothetical protein